jgi:hypothetical protein
MEILYPILATFPLSLKLHQNKYLKEKKLIFIKKLLVSTVSDGENQIVED